MLEASGATQGLACGTHTASMSSRGGDAARQQVDNHFMLIAIGLYYKFPGVHGAAQASVKKPAHSRTNAFTHKSCFGRSIMHDNV